MFNLKIVGGTIVDGTGRAGYRGDIGINGDRITAIGDLSAAESARTIDAAGKVVAPGLIDFHTHSDLSLLIDGHAMARLHDGVTTDVIGNCGIGTYPARKENRQLLLDYLGTRIIGSLPVKNEVVWDTAAEYYPTATPTRPPSTSRRCWPRGRCGLRRWALPWAGRQRSRPPICRIW